MANTTNFGWETPDDTDLVKDGAAAIRTVAGAIDTSLVDLKGGTTDQVLAKNSGTDMDFKWVAPTAGDIEGVTAGVGISGGGTSGTVTVTNSMATAIDAKGDLIAGTGADTFARLAVGTNGHTLVADSSESTGLKWQAPAAGGMTLLQSLSLSGASVTSSTFTPANYKSYYIVLSGIYLSNPNSAFQMRLNADTGSNYYRSTMGMNDTSFAGSRTSGGNVFLLATIGALSANGERTYGVITIDRINDTTEVPIQATVYTSLSSNADVRMNITSGTYNNSAAIESITFIGATQDFAAGTAYIYGVN
jgi:hypothetical protein